MQNKGGQDAEGNLAMRAVVSSLRYSGLKYKEFPVAVTSFH